MHDKLLLVEKFLNGALTDEERTAFAEILCAEPQLAEQVAFNKMMKQPLRRQETVRLQSLEQNYLRARRLKTLRYAALVGLVLTGLLWGVYQLVVSKQAPPPPSTPSAQSPTQLPDVANPADKSRTAPPAPPDTPQMPSSDPKGQNIVGETVQSGIALLDRLAQQESAFLNSGDAKAPWKKAFRQKRYPEAMRLLDEELDNTSKLEEKPVECFYAGAMHSVLKEGDPKKSVRYLEAVYRANNKFKKEAIQLLIDLYWRQGKLIKARKLLQDNPTLQSKLPAQMKKWLGLPEK